MPLLTLDTQKAKQTSSRPFAATLCLYLHTYIFYNPNAAPHIGECPISAIHQIASLRATRFGGAACDNFALVCVGIGIRRQRMRLFRGLNCVLDFEANVLVCVFDNCCEFISMGLSKALINA